MPRPKFVVRHFLACLAAPWEGTPGPDTHRTLESVGYRYPVPPDTEFPTELAFWLYARFYVTGGGDGFGRFSVEVYWQDAPEGERRVGRWVFGRVRLTVSRPVTSTAWPVGPVSFPGEGRYEFRLTRTVRRMWGVEERRIASEYVELQRSP